MSEDYLEGTYSKLSEMAEKKQQPASPPPVVEARTQKVIKAMEQTHKQSSNDVSRLASYHASKTDSQEDVIEVIRKAVKPIGKEALFSRLTSAEKDALADIVYGQKKKGIATSESVVTRIAVSYLVWDYQQNKQASILAKVLERLSA
ncbi:MAG TPA: hypothetical protein VH593_15715 [Ktedonobacteraceae bacterium]|jgi:DNA-binding FadR family transcriptional regulator